MLNCFVEKGGESYRCHLTERGFKCGKCLRGNIEWRRGSACKVCGAKVKSVPSIRRKHEYPNLLKGRPLNLRFI